VSCRKDAPQLLEPDLLL